MSLRRIDDCPASAWASVSICVTIFARRSVSARMSLHSQLVVLRLADLARCHPPLQQLGVRAHHGHRRAQFVRGVGDEGALRVDRRS